MSRILQILSVALIHLGLCRGLGYLALQLMDGYAVQAQPPILTRLLVLWSKVLYFPLITLALYPRGLFPGNLIYIPLFANSLLWALAIVLLWHWLRSKG
jgi:hypothetical protein